MKLIAMKKVKELIPKVLILVALLFTPLLCAQTTIIPSPNEANGPIGIPNEIIPESGLW